MANLEDLAKKYGRAYQCLRCLYRDGKEKIDVKRRIEGHINKYHLSMDQVGHYCRLCSFRCSDRKTLEEHERTYSRHARMAREQGVDVSDRSFLVSNPSPYTLGNADYVVLSKEKSLEFFKERAAKTKQKPTEDVMAASPDLQAFLDSLTSLDDPVINSQPVSTEEHQSAVEVTPVEALTEVQAEPLNLSIGSPVENILGQLLEGTEPIGKGDAISEEPPTKRRRMEKAHKRRSRSPSPPPSPASSASSSSTSSMALTAEQWSSIATAALAPLVEAVNGNTRAIRCLGANIEKALKKDLVSTSTQTSNHEDVRIVKRDGRDAKDTRERNRRDNDYRRHRR